MRPTALLSILTTLLKSFTIYNGKQTNENLFYTHYKINSGFYILAVSDLEHASLYFIILVYRLLRDVVLPELSLRR